MEKKVKQIHEVTALIFKIKGFYSEWARKHHIKYHELLILSVLYDDVCTQKQIGDLYHLPKQTVYNIISEYRKKNYLDTDSEGGLKLTESGKSYAREILSPLFLIEQKAAKQMGADHFQTMEKLVSEYYTMLECQLTDMGGKKV